MIAFLVLIIASFLLGSIPTGFLIGKYLGVDVRKAGSNNTGATNTARVAGKKAGLITLLFDLSKGAIPTSLPFILNGLGIDLLDFTAANIEPLYIKDLAATLGFSAILGHCYSPFLKFKGGKGVASAAGVFLTFATLETFVAILIFAGILYLSKFVSLSSILACLSICFLVVNSWFSDFNDISKVITIAITLLIVFKHKGNILRMLRKEENKFEIKGEKIL